LGKALGDQYSSMNWLRVIGTLSSLPVGIWAGPMIGKRGYSFQKVKDFVQRLEEGPWDGDWELVKAWYDSEEFLTAPAKWPPGVKQHFRRASPYEFSYGWCAKKTSMTDEMDLLVAYSSGMRVKMLSELLHQPVGLIEERLAKGAKDFLKRPWFRLWELGLDWSLVRLPPDISDSYLERIHYGAELARDPSVVPMHVLRRMVDSPRFMAYAMYVAPKKTGFLPHPLRFEGFQHVRPRLR
jgi:hypothetical protein